MADNTWARSHSIPNRARVGGSGFTAFFWQSQPIAFARQIAHASAPPVGPGPTPIQPLDEPYPIDIVTPAAQTIGTLTIELYEVYNRKIWDSLAEIAGAVDIVNVFIKVAELAPPGIRVVKVVQPPTKLRGVTQSPYFDVFHNCVVTNIDDGETIEIGTMEITKRMTIAYTRTTRHDYQIPMDENKAIALRDGRLTEYTPPAL